MSNQIVLSSLYDQLIETQPVTNGSALDQLRLQAHAAFKQNGFPSTKNEYFRFTNTKPILQLNYQFQLTEISDDAIAKAVAELQIPDLEAYQLVLVNGEINFQYSTLPTQAGINISALSSNLGNDTFVGLLNRQLDIADPMNGFAAANTAAFENGYSIVVDKNVVLDKPIVVYQLFSANSNVFVNPRNVISLDVNAQIDVIETSITFGDVQYFINSFTDIIVEKDAKITHNLIQTGKANEAWINHTQVDQKTDSHYQNHVYTFPGARFVRNNLNVELNGQHTDTHMYGLYLVGDNQLTDNHTLVGHRSPNCESNQLYKGVVLSNGRGVFNGRIFVHPDAQKTNAYQSSKNMLFSKEGTINAKPQLEIYADDVKCSHGTTIGQFDPMQLFYLQARGIGETLARTLLVNAFAFDVTNKIEIEPLRSYLQNLVAQTIESNQKNG